ncbi:hypothetical protein GCM10020295_79350 [Streptomyces cinereospinus]
MSVTQSPRNSVTRLLDRVGIPPALSWGFLGLLIFMIGDGVESGYLSPYLLDEGVPKEQVALLFTVYGVTASIAAWFSGALSDLWGPRRVMMLGLGIWAALQVMFLVAVPSGNVPLLMITYGLRGFGYPLFAYGFLVWVTAVTPKRRLGSAVGWFWFAFTGGLPTLGSLVASFTVPWVGPYPTLWGALALVLAGGLIALLLVREPTGRRRLVPAGERPWPRCSARSPSSGAVPASAPARWSGPSTRRRSSASWSSCRCTSPTRSASRCSPGSSCCPRCSPRTSSSTCSSAWSATASAGSARSPGSAVWAVPSPRCCSTTAPGPVATTTRSPWPWSACSARPSRATCRCPRSCPRWPPEHKGQAMSALNLGAGASAFLGPAIVGLFLGPLGVQGVMWIFALLYLASAGLTVFLALPRTAAPRTPAVARSVALTTDVPDATV